MDQPASFERVLESDIEQLAAEVQVQRDRPEMQNAAEQELLKEAIRAFPDTPPSPTVPQSSSVASDDATSPLPHYAAQAPAETKLEIEYLLSVALTKGLGSALAESEKAPAFVQDAFHDALAGRLYPELQKRGILK